MSLNSDLLLDITKFNPAAISPQTAKLNERLIAMGEHAPKWFEVGAENYRIMRRTGQTTLPKPTMLPQGKSFLIPSRERNRYIPCRIMFPESHGSATNINGVFMHVHGGGWVLQSESDQDFLLQTIANDGNLAVISVGYRLAPECPFPAGPEDCFDAVDWLVVNARDSFGKEMIFIGGESAGAHLALLSVTYLISTHSSFQHLAGVVLNFGIYDLSLLPQATHFKLPLVLDRHHLEAFVNAFLPDIKGLERRDPTISPLYLDLEQFRGRLPPAIFTCGTMDMLLDDTVFMSCKWQMAGGRAVTKFYPGASHGFILFDGKCQKDVLADIKAFLNDSVKT